MGSTILDDAYLRRVDSIPARKGNRNQTSEENMNQVSNPMRSHAADETM